MLRKIMLTSVIILVLLLVVFLGMAFKSRAGEAPGLSDKRLSPCQNKPNCVCTEFPEHASYFEPLILPDSIAGAAELITMLESTVLASGGVITIKEKEYMAAEFSSRILGFVDDFEVRIDLSSRKVHFRSASRIGYSDLGVNRARVAQIVSQLESALILKKG